MNKGKKSREFSLHYINLIHRVLYIKKTIYGALLRFSFKDDIFIFISLTVNMGSTWIGLKSTSTTQPSQKSSYRWQFGGNTVGYESYDGGEPNNIANEFCCEMRKEKSYNWNNIPCTLTRSFICEMANCWAESSKTWKVIKTNQVKRDVCFLLFRFWPK